MQVLKNINKTKFINNLYSLIKKIDTNDNEAVYKQQHKY